MKLYRVKITKNHFHSGEISQGLPIKTSAELKSKQGEYKIIIEHTYYNNDHTTKTNINESVCQNAQKIFEEIENLNLQNLKNNYFDDNKPECFTSWEIEYNNFKIVGTFNNLINEYLEISRLLNFESVIQNNSISDVGASPADAQSEEMPGIEPGSESGQ